MLSQTRTTVVIVGGSSGAGKTRLANALGDRLGWPVISRDDLKEVLLDAFAPADRAASSRLGGPSWTLLYRVVDRLIGRVPGVIVESNVRVGRSEGELLAHIDPGDAVYLHCVAAWETVEARLRARSAAPARHPGHFDAQAVPEVQAAWERGVCGPMDLGIPPVIVRTDAATDDGYDPAPDRLVEAIERRRDEVIRRGAAPRP